MSAIKFCGITGTEEIAAVNRLLPEYIGFVFAKKSRRCVSKEQARELGKHLDPAIKKVGVFVNETPERVAELLESGVIDLAQLHGDEDEAYITKLRRLTDAPVIRAFCIRDPEDLKEAKKSSADYILLDAGKGEGLTFEWGWLEGFDREYFLAGGLTPDNVEKAVRLLAPYAVDVSSGIETNGVKDAMKMERFTEAVRWRSGNGASSHSDNTGGTDHE